MWELTARISGGVGGGEGRRTKVVCAQKMLRYKSAKMCFSLFTVPRPPYGPSSCRPTPPTQTPWSFGSFIISAAVCTVARSGRRLASLPWLYPLLLASFFPVFVLAMPRGSFLQESVWVCVAWILN